MSNSAKGAVGIETRLDGGNGIVEDSWEQSIELLSDLQLNMKRNLSTNS